MNGIAAGKFIRRFLLTTYRTLCIYREPRTVIVQSPPTSQCSVGPALANDGEAAAYPSSRGGELTNRKEAQERVCTRCERCKQTSSSSSIPVLMLEQLMSEKLSRQGQEIATRLGALGQYGISWLRHAIAEILPNRSCQMLRICDILVPDPDPLIRGSD